MTKMLRSTLAMLLCSGLVFAFGLAGCGDEDEEGKSQPTCRSAVDTLTSDDCTQMAVATVPPWIEGCVIGLCGGDPACIEENCVLAYITIQPPACQEAIAYLLHEADTPCRECFGECSLAFFSCVLTPGNLPQDCVDTESECINLCP